jgi:hypothetical protein
MATVAQELAEFDAESLRLSARALRREATRALQASLDESARPFWSDFHARKSGEYTFGAVSLDARADRLDREASCTACDCHECPTCKAPAVCARCGHCARCSNHAAGCAGCSGERD